jgi:thiopurine S-methyltransferase
MAEDWLARWQQGRIGWHETDGNKALQEFWPDLSPSARVLVPLCGKSQDLLWLARSGCRVSGVEISPVAVETFFSENELEFERYGDGELTAYAARDMDIVLYCGDYLEFHADPFDALYDRGALVALPAGIRPEYAAHTERLLDPAAARLVITLEYDQAMVAGPPFAVLPAEIKRYWPDLVRVAGYDDIDNAPPKFRAAGLTRMMEVVWLSAAKGSGSG